MNFSSVQARALLRVLVRVAEADGKVEGAERDLLDLFADHAFQAGGLREDWSAGSNDLAADLSQLTAPPLRTVAMHACASIALVDGSCSPSEEAMLRAIAAALGVDAPSLREREEAYWSEHASDARLRLAQANDRFLHALAKATLEGGELSSAKYDTLVALLDREKDAIVGELLEGQSSAPPPRG